MGISELLSINGERVKKTLYAIGLFTLLKAVLKRNDVRVVRE